jgi:nitronate monooxygenase
MWSRNAFTERLNLKWPILQAPMGWLSTPALAAAVSNAGGLGGLGMWGFSAEDAETSHCRLPATKQRQPERQLSALAGAEVHAAGKRSDAKAVAASLRRQRPGCGS